MLTLEVFDYEIGKLQEHIFQAVAHKENEWIIGRASTCDLVLPSPEISRVHGRISYYQGEYCFTDLGSTDGSRLNNQTVKVNQKYVLKHDDLIRIGNFVISVKAIAKAENLKLDSLNFRLKQQPTWTEGELIVRCVRVIEETSDVKTFSFVADSPIQPAFQPGQFVTLELEIENQKVLRSYSISSPPSRPQTLDITVKRVSSPTTNPELPPGLVSNWLHDNIIVGSKVKLCGGPMGKFTCANKSSQKLLMISAGSGVTPMLSMARWLYDIGSDRDVVFCYSVRTPDDIIMYQELKLIATRYPHFRLVITVTRPESGKPWWGFTGRLSDLMLKQIAPDLSQREVYVCGPEKFMSEAKNLLTSLGLPLENYYQESFGVNKKNRKDKPQEIATSLTELLAVQTIANNSASPMISFARSQKEVICNGEESILEVAQQHNIDIRSGCMQGVCGACKKLKLDGEVKYENEPDALSPDEIAQNYILPCVAFPVDKVVIEA
ncbi:MAG: FHA domain-containing protein [Xenococcaceae cyanobacterium MO_188.B29]|nr:FHA domain-containing protein [Xenococcaceae cyanobacterium MO_188.B29]